MEAELFNQAAEAANNMGAKIPHGKVNSEGLCEDKSYNIFLYALDEAYRLSKKNINDGDVRNLLCGAVRRHPVMNHKPNQEQTPQDIKSTRNFCDIFIDISNDTNNAYWFRKQEGRREFANGFMFVHLESLSKNQNK